MGFMECKNWQETGLMYLSGELTREEASQFLEHTSVCDVCKQEVGSYEYLQKTVLSSEIFCEAPSEAIDAKILAACSHKPMITGMNLFGATWVKRTVYASLFLVFGLGAGVYFAMNYYAPVPTNSQASASQQPIPASPVTAAAPATTVAMHKDSLASHLKDSLNQPENQIIARPIDASSQQGIVTVDLKKE
jgi:hypothetical protein